MSLPDPIGELMEESHLARVLAQDLNAEPDPALQALYREQVEGKPRRPAKGHYGKDASRGL